MFHFGHVLVASNRGDRSALVLAFFPACAHAGEDGPIAISANDQMKFDATAITAKAGQKLTIVLTNDGSVSALALLGQMVTLTVDADRAAGLKTLVTLPLAGYVAADMNGPVALEAE